VDLTLNADQQDLRAALRDRLRDVWTPDRLRATADAPTVDRTHWVALAEMGVFGLTLPEADGGLGLGMAEAVILFEELGKALVPGPVTATFLAAGLVPADAVVTMVDTSASVRLAEHVESATQLVVVADDGLFLLAAKDFVTSPIRTPVDPLTPVSQVAVGTGAGARVGTAADAARWRSRGALLTAALQVGVAQGGLDLAVRYATERVQFGRVIGSFQAVKHLLAESLVRVDLARAAVLVAALLADDPVAEDADEHLSAAKLLADDAATQGGRCCVQVHGGMGFSWEVLAHLYLKRAWVLETCFGAADEHALRLADSMVIGS
jgi:alkylation response protein AidB-like acyl-CoA dehydrogenase